MIFGILWELISRQITTSYDAFPRFNSRIFFYLFLPSTVLESGALLSNKWLFLNLFPILIHSIFGTLLYSSFLGFTIYYLSRQSLFNLNPPIQSISPVSTSIIPQKAPLFYSLPPLNYSNNDFLLDVSSRREFKTTVTNNWESEPILYTLYDKSYVTSGSSHELNNLTLADCLIFGTILSSVDATTMLSIFSSLQVNEKLHYLVLGESLMNNAVVLVIINLLLDFFNATRLTVVKIYIAIIQFFITIIGSIFVGLVLASIALASVRLTKRFRVSRAITSYQNQCQAMVETLLILKLAYLTYTLANLVGTSSIVSLATFGILQDQYIKHNLNLRSQLAYRQVILATRTMGFSLVYPLLGMLLVEVANTSQVFQTWLSLDTSDATNNSLNIPQTNQSRKASTMISDASSVASKLTHLANQANFYWNFKFLALVISITFIYRFVLVIGLTQICNLFTSSQLKIKFREQILVAFGGLKGPLAFAIVHKLIESEEYRDRTIKNKHLFIYTILFITFISTLIKGSCIRPLVVKMKLTLCHAPPSLDTHSTLVFDEINCKVTEYISSGLNSLLGRTKSPYDRFVELNETHIKPWLTRDGSNTNWLSVFYDTLILDETLNENCFYRSLVGNPLLQTHWSSMESGSMVPNRGKIDPHRGLPELKDNNHDHYEVKGEKIWKTCFLDTIDEDGMPDKGQDVKTRPKHMRNISLRRIPSSTSIKQTNPIEEITVTNDNARTLLKEFVMFNLKLEDAKTRRRSAGFSPKVNPSNGDNVKLRTRKPRLRMMSSTSSGEMAQETSSFELAQVAKHKLITQMERNLSQSSLRNTETTSGLALGTQLRPMEADVCNRPTDYKSRSYRGKLPLEESSTVLPQQQIKQRRNVIAKNHTKSRPQQVRLHRPSD